MNVWIFVISAVFTPVIEPLGLSTPSVELPPMSEPSIDPTVDDMRYHGIEQMLAKLDVDASNP